MFSNRGFGLEATFNILAQTRAVLIFGAAQQLKLSRVLLPMARQTNSWGLQARPGVSLPAWLHAEQCFAATCAQYSGQVTNPERLIIQKTPLPRMQRVHRGYAMDMTSGY
jgi:hypothetical protein